VPLVVIVLVAFALLAAACGDDDDALVLEPPDQQDQPSDGQSDADQAAPEVEGELIDLSLSRRDIDCSRFGLGEDELFGFSTAHFVVDGVLGAVCLGELDETLVESWNVLANMTPPGQLADLGLFAGFESFEERDETTLAFVNSVDEDGSEFQMSVNLAAAVDDPDELVLTMAHEFTHVFTATRTELDRSPEAADDCPTYFNGEGCYVEDSLMTAWIETFWGDRIDDLDPDIEATASEGQARCDADPGFFGAYAASNPEEDFAESFAAFVLRVEAISEAQQVRLDFIDERPGLTEFRDRATAAGLGPLDHSFDECG
jgi:hypothetical protein